MPMPTSATSKGHDAEWATQDRTHPLFTLGVDGAICAGKADVSASHDACLALTERNCPSAPRGDTASERPVLRNRDGAPCRDPTCRLLPVCRATESCGSNAVSPSMTVHGVRRVIRRRFPVRESPTRRTALAGSTLSNDGGKKWLKPLGKACHEIW